MTEQDLLGYAYEHYPIGTKFIDSNGNERTISNSDHWYDKCDGGTVFCGSTPESEWELGFSNPALYEDGEWVKVVGASYIKIIDKGFISTYSSKNVKYDDLENGKTYRVSDRKPMSHYINKIVIEIRRNVYAEIGCNSNQKLYEVSTELEFNKQNKMKPIVFNVTRGQLQELHSVACDRWKVRIEALTDKKLGKFNNSCMLDYDEVSNMFNAATASQMITFNKVFPEYNEHNEDKNAFIKKFHCEDTVEFSRKLFGDGSTLSILDGMTPNDRPDLKNRAFYIPSNYDVNVVKVDGWHYIEITKK